MQAQMGITVTSTGADQAQTGLLDRTIALWKIQIVDVGIIIEERSFILNP